MSARTSHDAQGVGASRSPGWTLAKMAWVLTKARFSSSIAGDPLVQNSPSSRRTQGEAKRNRAAHRRSGSGVEVGQNGQHAAVPVVVGIQAQLGENVADVLVDRFLCDHQPG